MFEYSGILGLIVLILDVWAIVSTVSSHETVGMKVLWVLIIIILPILGFLIWFFFGPRGR